MSAFIIALAKMLASIISAGLLYQGFSPTTHGALLTKIAGVIVSLCTIVAVIPDVIDFFKHEASQTEQKFWDGVLKYREKHKNNAMDCAYLKKYPDGEFVVLAKGECPEKMADSTPAPAADAAAPAPAPTETRQAFEPEMVQLPNGSWMGKYEVTQAQWQAVMGNNPSYFKKCGDNCPVENVIYNDVQVYIQKLNEKTGKSYRLPTEEQWFEACQAGQTTEYCGSDNADEVAWYDSNSGDTTHEVGGKKANAWGLYDMSGNVREWTASFYDNSNTLRVLRGGSWDIYPLDLRSAFRNNYGAPGSRGNFLGFRLSRM